jgi:hypothetical protein
MPILIYVIGIILPKQFSLIGNDIFRMKFLSFILCSMCDLYFISFGKPDLKYFFFK